MALNFRDLESLVMEESGKWMPLGGAGVLETEKRWLFAYGATVPTDATGGYEEGCLFQHTDGSAGTAAYLNIGSLSSCNFDALVTSPLTDSTALTFGTGSDVSMAWDNTNSILEFLPSADDTGKVAIGDGTTDMDFQAFLGTANDYLLCDVGSKTVTVNLSRSSQTTENIGANIAVTTDSTYLTGSNITYSSARGSSALKLVSTFTGVAGGFSNIYSNITTTAAQTADGAGVIGYKGVVTNSAAMTDGEVYGGQFIAKHSHGTNIMTATASLIGLEGWAYIADAGVARTVIGGNFGWHNEATGATYGSGSVIRGIQVFCDNAASAGTPTESTGVCIWNQAGAITNCLSVVNSGSGFTNFLNITDDGTPAQSTSTTVTNVGSKGWIKCLVGTATRYIALGDGVT